MSQKFYNVLIALLAGAFIIVCAVLLWRLFTGADSGEPETPPVPADVWERIQANGKIVVGTSADYPPFEYYDSNYQLTGFDIALIREVGQQLGVEVELRDMAFDGLGNALQVDQIDAAISAISVNNDRRVFANFSQIYFVSEDGILANASSQVGQITQLLDMASYRVGVQDGTVYENWIRAGLVETNLMPAQNLNVYTQVAQGVNDLKAGNIDLFVMDLQPALTAVDSGGVRLVGRGLNLQQYGIAMKQGEGTLQAKLNEALTFLQNTGRINQLVEQYMEIPPDQIIPPPTPVSSATPFPTATPPPCIDSMKFVQDLNLDDNNMQSPPEIPPGVPFKKGWRVQNVGTCNWDGSYYLGFLSGNSSLSRMGGQNTPIVGVVQPGQYVDIWVDLVSPAVPGTYQGFWGMHNNQGVQFGDRIWVGVKVPAPATSTPPPTQTPSPNIAFNADRTNIMEGECVVFNWNVTGAQAVYFYPQGQPWQANPVAAQGSRSVCPANTTTYELRVTWQDGSQEIRQITINVTPQPNAPDIHQFMLVPEGQITLGQCVDVRWSVSGDVTDVSVLRNDVGLWSGLPVAGSRQDCPPTAGSVTYALVATGPGGNSRSSKTIQVVQPVTQPPPPTATTIPPTPVPVPPTIQSFVVNPDQIESGNCVNVRWHITGDVRLVQLKRNSAIILDGTGTDGQISDCLTAEGVTTYRIEATGNDNLVVGQDASVTVSPPSMPDMPLQGTNWELETYHDGSGAVRNVLDGTKITAVFDDQNKVTGSAGCNDYSARYDLFTIEGSISISQLSIGRQACASPPGIMEQEQAYTNALVTATQYEIKGDVLELKDNDGEVILQFKATVGIQPFDS